MTELEKHHALCMYLLTNGHLSHLTFLPVQLRLCETDHWNEYDVLRLWTEENNIYYATPSYQHCSLLEDDWSDVRNSAYLYDQLLGKMSKRDRNLF